ncbi:MAG: tyrosine--tRNA ligase [Acidimicrobiia bacterium]|nr:tyrosine--tRNA ligase [Acidimicrobiia bacterium]
MADFIQDLEWRGALYDASDGAREAIQAGPLTAYAGFDPTASSLHVGNLMPIMALARLQRAGHSPIAVVGGGTGLIGDPSGKAAERTLLTPEQVAENVAGIHGQLARFLDFGRAGNPARLVNNADWLGPLSAMAFLRDVGKHFTVNYLLAKESIRRRVESADGISYTEFSYLLLQAFDFLELFDRTGCTLQVGGSDQWGNITAGIDLIRRLRGARAYGLVLPLVTTASGTKFGKTEAGTVWLDAGRTSPFRFFQFWLNADDADAVTYLKYFTFLARDVVDELVRATGQRPEAREAQRVLAREVTTLVHGREQAERAERAAGVLFGQDLASLSAEDVLAALEGAPSSQVPAASFAGDGLSLVDLLVQTRLASSKAEGRRLVQSGGVYVNDRRVTDVHARAGAADAIGGRLLVLRRGQRQQHVVMLA